MEGRAQIRCRSIILEFIIRKIFLSRFQLLSSSEFGLRAMAALLQWGARAAAQAGARRWMCSPSLVARLETEANLELRREAPSVESLVAILV